MSTASNTDLSACSTTPRTVPLFELVGSLSSAMDMISPAVTDHHARVAAIAAELAGVLDLDAKDKADLVFAALVHDIGAFALSTRLDALEFEADTVHHARVGRELLASFPGFSRISDVVGRHHGRFDTPDDANPDVTRLGLMLHLADRVDVHLRTARPTDTPDELFKRVRSHTGGMFDPEHVQAFDHLAHEPQFWRKLTIGDPRTRLKTAVAASDRELDMEETAHFSRLISRVIDFRSRFTATHSRGVASGAEHLARLMGLSPDDCRQMYTAGNLHDLGKLAVPRRLLEKPAGLTPEEFDTVRQHALFSLHILSTVPGLETVANWAGNHHERLDGRGYPRGHTPERLDRGSRIMAVADVFTALTEDRPYRAGMNREQSARILNSMAGEGILDDDTVQTLMANYAELNRTRVSAQQSALEDFKRFEASL